MHNILLTGANGFIGSNILNTIKLNYKVYIIQNPDTKKSVTWKKNRAVFFSREERKTWHSFEGHEGGERRVLVYNLCTKQLKKVFNIEKKNYLYGMLRYKLNPYIFKIFKRVI